MEMIKNFIASAFFIPAILCNYLAKPFVFLATRFSLTAIYLHEKFETKIGKVITQQKALIYQNAIKAEALKITQKEQDNSKNAEANKLSDIISGESKASNVFVLGKKKKDEQ